MEFKAEKGIFFSQNEKKRRAFVGQIRDVSSESCIARKMNAYSCFAFHQNQKTIQKKKEM